MKIPAPVAEFGDRVEVRNYRRRDNSWELGTVTMAKFVPGYTAKRHPDIGGEYRVESRWIYGVRIDPRPARTSVSRVIDYDLTVREDAIRRIA